MRVSGGPGWRELSRGFTLVEDASIVPVAWVCGYAPAPGGMAVLGANRTSVANALLPLACRGP